MKLRYLLVLFGWAMLTGAQASHLQVSLDDIVLLSQQGVSDQTILLFLENREAGFALDADALDKLLLAGVSGEVIRYLFSQNTTAQTAGASEPTIPPAYTTNSNTYISYPTVTYLDNYPGYYYTPYYYGGFYSFGFSSYPHRWFGHYSRGGRHATNAHHGRRRHVVNDGHSTGRHSNRHDDHGAPNTSRHYGTHTGSGNISHRGQHETIHGGGKRTESVSLNVFHCSCRAVKASPS